MANPNKRPDPLMRPGCGENHKNKMVRNRNEDNEKRKMEKYFNYRCGDLD